MGRYCYFDSGFEYKFWFGIQDSGFDFLTWCAVDYRPRKNDDNYDFTIMIDDTYLDVLQTCYPGYPLPDFMKYDTTTEGTQQLYDDMEKRNADFCLACIVYHIGMYTDLMIQGVFEP